MYLYVYESFRGGRQHRKETEELAAYCVDQYMMEEGPRTGCAPGNTSREILRTERGKPYFKDLPFRFSVSHTGNLWVCLIDTQDVGVDVQKIRKCRSDKIAERYYTPDERQYIHERGEDGFFQIWTRKEAYVKYTGDGLTERIRFFSTLKESGVNFMDFDLMDQVKGSCCMKTKGELWIRQIR